MHVVCVYVLFEGENGLIFLKGMYKNTSRKIQKLLFQNSFEHLKASTLITRTHKKMIITEALLRFVVLLVFKSLRCMYYKDDTRDDL